MNEDILKKYEEYKQAKESGISNKERYKLLANFVATNPADVNDFLDLIKGKKDLNNERNRLFISNTIFNRFNCRKPF